MSDKVKIAGYSQKVVYADSIEYRNFSPDLVGLQLASDGGTPLFTMGNFSITTNTENKKDKFFKTNKFSNFVSLTDLKLTLNQTKELLTNNAGVILNLNKTNLNYYAQFGSLSEYIRVSLEDIITKWPASLYMTPVSQTSTGQILNGYTFEDYSYDVLSEISTFKIDTNFIDNKFEINYLENFDIQNTFNASNTTRNLTLNYLVYSILVNDDEFPVIGFTGSTYLKNDYIYFKVKGNAFSGQSTNSKTVYHIKPNATKANEFFNSIPTFENYLLNRLVTPKYTASFKYPIKTESGIVLYITNSVTWPVSDGYNIDFNTTNYVNYASKLLDISTASDLVSSDLMNRFLVTESISDFDTTPVHLSDLDQDSTGQKMNKTLRIYGRAYDEINNFISGIAFANVVTYDKEDNTPDIYLKNLASVLGWDLISSVLENNLLANYVSPKQSTYSGQTVGLTAVEADIELWRRIILNTPWIWKSKGARKSVEFLLRFIGAPQGLVKFNEYIYKADSPIDVDLFQKALSLNNKNTDLSIYPIDSNGYPRPLPDTTDMYFQNYGLWYRETGGDNSTVDIHTGNNPHLGPYDGGYKYINQFRTLIPNFSAVTISSQTTTTNSVNLYSNYNLGAFDIGVTTATTVNTVELTSLSGTDLSDCIVFTPSIITDPNPSVVLNPCGCPCEGSDNVMSICVDTSKNNNNATKPKSCLDTMTQPPIDDVVHGIYRFSYYQYNQDGSVYTDGLNPIPYKTPFASKECCKTFGGVSALYSNENNTGYICCDNSGKCGCIVSCKWVIDGTIMLPQITAQYNGAQANYLSFINIDGSKNVVTPDGCNCVRDYTIAVPNITDPYTSEIGYGCALTALGEQDILLGNYGALYKTYNNRKNGVIGCSDVSSQTAAKVTPT